MGNKIIILLSLTLLSACAIDKRNSDQLRYLAIAECVEDRASKSEFNQSKSNILIQNECEKILFMDEAYQKIANKKYRKNPRLTYQEDQEYFDEETWFMVTEGIRKTHYPTYLAPEDEVTRVKQLNEKQAHLEDKSVQRAYEPNILPVSPYLMNLKELAMANEAIRKLINENRENKTLYRSLSSIGLIVLNEKRKRERLH